MKKDQESLQIALILPKKPSPRSSRAKMKEKGELSAALWV
jgi:hypothetical protein